MTAVGKPRVTAIVPAYNSEGFILEALRSLAAQTWEDLEILVGDDASTDRTLSVVKEFAAGRPNVRVVAREHNLGWLANTNDLMGQASGELMFLAFHDDTSTRRTSRSSPTPWRRTRGRSWRSATSSSCNPTVRGSRRPSGTSTGCVVG